MMQDFVGAGMFFGVIFLGGYLCGLFPSGPWVARGSLGGRHLRDVGSGSTGATNVLRYAGWGRAFAVVALDVMKGIVAILLARYGVVLGGDLFALRFGEVEALVWGEFLAGVGCLLGHCFPLWSRGFRGGKGVASLMGIILLLSPGMFFVSVLLWLGILGVWGFSSLASLGVCLFLLLGGVFGGVGGVGGGVGWGIVGIVGIVAGRHWGNAGRLLRGEEGRVFGGVRGLWGRWRR